jgi:hypothetical protein
MELGLRGVFVLRNPLTVDCMSSGVVEAEAGVSNLNVVL